MRDPCKNSISSNNLCSNTLAGRTAAFSTMLTTDPIVAVDVGLFDIR